MNPGLGNTNVTDNLDRSSGRENTAKNEAAEDQSWLEKVEEKM